MNERLDAYRKTAYEVSLILGRLGQPVTSSTTGDIVWATHLDEQSPFGPEIYKYTLAVSPTGRKIIKNIGPFLQQLEAGKFEPTIRSFNEITGLRGVVKRTSIGGFLKPIPVYVKTLRPVAGFGLDITGIEQFTAMRLLEVNGVQVAPPLLATRYRLVTREVVGLPAHESSATFRNYLNSLNGLREQLISQGLWNEEWRIEEQPSNYLQTLRGIVAIDPIFRNSAFLW